MMRSSGRLIIAILVLFGVSLAFWMLLISPKRQEADRLGQEVEQLSSSVAAAQSEVAAASAAKQSFPADYRQLVVLGQAAPAGDETASLLVELEKVANSSGVAFDSIQLESSGGETAAVAPEATAPPEASSVGPSGAVPAAATISPTEVSASLLPLGASVGPAGLYVMPYSLQFSGGFFEIAKFIRKVDALVRTDENGVAVDGRLITIGSFTLDTGAEEEGSAAELAASLKVTTFLSPPGQGITAGASPSAPAPAPAPAAESTTTVSAPEASASSPQTGAAK